MRFPKIACLVWVVIEYIKTENAQDDNDETEDKLVSEKPIGIIRWLLWFYGRVHIVQFIIPHACFV